MKYDKKQIYSQEEFDTLIGEAEGIPHSLGMVKVEDKSKDKGYKVVRVLFDKEGKLQPITITQPEKTTLPEIADMKTGNTKYTIAGDTSVKKLRRYDLDKEGNPTKKVKKKNGDYRYIPHSNLQLPKSRKEWEELNKFVMKEVY